MTRSLPLRTGRRCAALVFALLIPAAPGQGQEPCSRGRISEIEIRTADPYDEEATADEATFDWAFRALNWLHLETREQVIRWELLFQEGSCLDPLRLSETERSLRGLSFLQSASVTSERLPDGSHRVEVETRDSWALAASVGVELEDGLELTGIQATYGNVLGWGLRAQLFRRSFRERLRRGLLLRHTNVLGTEVDAVVHGGRTLSGDYLSQSLHKPFQDEFADHAVRQVYARRDDFFAYALPPGFGFTPALLRYRAELVELAYQRRLGGPTERQMLLGVGLTSESFSAPLGAEGTRAVVDGGFDESVTAPDSVRAVIATQAAPYATRRTSFFLGARRMRFETRRGLDAITAVQDLAVGDEVLLAVAPGLALWDEDHADLLLRLQGRVGLLGSQQYSMTRFDVQGRRAFVGAPGPSGWRDVVGSVRTDGYWTYSSWASLYGRARYSLGWRTDRPFQLTLGGRDGIRAYSEDAFPGSRLLFLSLEQRFNLEAVSPGFADLGAALFVDAGQTWAGDAPFGADSGWQAGVGLGLRGAPAGARRVIRMDLTLPLTDRGEVRGVAFRISAEIFGVLDRRRWPSQIERSRWYGNEPDMSRRVPDPLAGN
ncbi:MAG: BamA/TamA family outer membrane protein [Longimicrobiales bacterium]|nr:BamA/TamA family outer membrane protein [Longimicrobiales bacterium]